MTRYEYINELHKYKSAFNALTGYDFIWSVKTHKFKCVEYSLYCKTPYYGYDISLKTVRPYITAPISLMLNPTDKGFKALQSEINDQHISVFKSLYSILLHDFLQLKWDKEEGE